MIARRLALVIAALCSVACGDTSTPSTDAGGIDAAAIDAARDAEPSWEDAAPDASAAGPCDDALALDDDDPMHAAAAIGLCEGLVSAAWTLPDGSPPGVGSFDLGHGILPGFGPAVSPREGARFLGLSTGAARAVSDPGYPGAAGLDRGDSTALPVGFPEESPACPGVLTGPAHDGIALRVSVDVPEGANGFRVLLKHHTPDWPAYVCAPSEDVFALVVTPAPPGARPSGDVARDPDGNPLSAASSFIDVCGCAGGPPCTAGGTAYACASGTAELEGTGFEANAATPWLELRVPATAGARIELAFMAWDSVDGLLDSTTLIDGFQWISDAPSASEMRLAP